ncbi:type II toxin-antitoxin system VapB family antitoxin [Pseudaminobacter sp. 19-2017]|uniref:Type II toxin-antitoxin system VapB family antitoxin n=1 Tax=Pseudaminobacter soli (ex Zhang et al. 2022) TaxID=2831468 RepID=A0A942E054_9HYPH|nr:type II toxin-antitoxin system VapB family antitoxin [Pseudaminobacter soli]MBS3650377.1 type II toxin-antitoxin system VapB family antitoxin [Pseudaminobacter soli]
MAITIRNKTTEDLIRQIGRRTGEEPGAVIERLVKAEAGRDRIDEVPEEKVRRRMAVFEELDRKYPYRGPKLSWEEIKAEMDSIFEDELNQR